MALQPVLGIVKYMAYKPPWGVGLTARVGPLVTTASDSNLLVQRVAAIAWRGLVRRRAARARLRNTSGARAAGHARRRRVAGGNGMSARRRLGHIPAIAQRVHLKRRKNLARKFELY